ncbi:MAG TPA: class I SAM-dependent methyltransferase [Bacillales bacterium]|nr:class I SAM-dependent methyltransferase [Bacillales bacterium]
MADHYFTKQPNAKSRPKTWDAVLKGRRFRFTSDEGVFAKHGIDPGTEWLIEAFEMPGADGSILDVGCGYGPIGICLAKQYPERRIVMVDINERAVALAVTNAKANDAGNVLVMQSDLFADVPAEPFAAIVSNPPIRAGKNVVYCLFESAYDRLVDGGELWIVIRKQQGAASALKKLQSVFRETSVIFKKKGYVVIKAVK